MTLLRVSGYILYMETTTNHIHFDHNTCTECGWNAGDNNGWFGTDSRCLDCRSDADSFANGWTPENSLS